MKNSRGVEQYSDTMSRLYPELHKLPEGVTEENYALRHGKDRVFSREVTFQVTDRCSLACFPAGTKILMSNLSYKNIENIVIGDEVMSFFIDCSGNPVLEKTKVTHTFIRHDMLLDIIDSDEKKVTTTMEHPFLYLYKDDDVSYADWARAEDLEAGDLIYEYDNNNNSIKLNSIQLTAISSTYETVYNFETENHHYIANNFLVHNCTYCYQINKGKRRMSFETAKKFVDLLFSGEKGFYDYINKDCSPAIILDFIGGEPFLEVELIDKVCDYFMDKAIELHHPWAKNFMISICSNGVAYFEPAVQKFLNKWRNRISFSITIDGDKELHDSCRVFPDGSPSYDKAVAAAKDWMNKGYYMGSKVTIAPGNIDYLGRALKHMMSLGYDDINCNCVYENVWEQEHSTKLYRQLKEFIDYLYDNELEDSIYISILDTKEMKWQNLDEINTWCGGNGSMLACDPDGGIYTCLRYMESSLGPDIKAPRIGNVDEGICQRQEYVDILCDMCSVTRRSYNTDECFYCPISTGCGDCAAYNYQSSGSFHKRATYICEMHKARCLATAYYWGKYYEKHPDKSKGKFKCYMPEDWILKIITQEEYDELKSVSGIEWLPLRWQDVKEILEGKAVVEEDEI